MYLLMRVHVVALEETQLRMIIPASSVMPNDTTGVAVSGALIAVIPQYCQHRRRRAMTPNWCTNLRQKTQKIQKILHQ